MGRRKWYVLPKENVALARRRQKALLICFVIARGFKPNSLKDAIELLASRIEVTKNRITRAANGGPPLPEDLEERFFTVFSRISLNDTRVLNSLFTPARIVQKKKKQKRAA